METNQTSLPPTTPIIQNTPNNTLNPPNKTSNTPNLPLSQTPDTLNPQTKTLTPRNTSDYKVVKLLTVVFYVLFCGIVCYFYTGWMVGTTVALSVLIMYMPNGKAKNFLLQIATAASMALPIFGTSVMERIRMTGHGLVLLLKVWDYIVEHRDNPKKHSQSYTLKQLLFYFFHPMSDLPAERHSTISDIKLTLCDAMLKFFIVGFAAAIDTLLPNFIGQMYLVKSSFGLVYFYFAIDGLLQINAVFMMWLTGWYIPPMFHSPLLSQSPRDFWSKRWNMMVHKFVHKHFFLPMKKAGLPTVLPVVCIGLFTSLLHEYIVVFSALSLEWFGQMSVFFLIHVLASVFQVYLYKTGFWGRVPPLVFNKVSNVLLHTTWFVVTAPLFLKPFFGASEISWLVI